MARGDYAWYGDWMDDHYQPWIDHKKRTSDAWDAYQKANEYRSSYLGGRTAGTQGEFEEWQRRAALSDSAFSKYNALLEQEPSFTEGAKTAFDAWSNFKPESEPTKPDYDPDEIFLSKDDYAGGNKIRWTREYLDANPELWNRVESKDTGGGFIKNEDTGEVTNFGESKYHRIINEDGTGTIFPITDTKSAVQGFDIAWGDPEYGDVDTPAEKQYLKDTGLYDPEGSDYQFKDLLDSSPTPIPNVGIDRAKPLIEEALGIPDPDYIQDEGSRPAGTGTGGGKVWDTISPWLIPESEREKMNDPFRWDSLLPSSDETLIASADPSNLKINTDTDTDAARAAKQREVIDKNLGFGIARDWETTNNQIRDTSTNTESLFIDPANLPSNLEMLDQTIEDNTYTTGDKIKDFAKEFAKNTPEVLGGIAERLASVPVGAIPLGRSMLHTAGWTQGTDDNPMRIDLTPGASRQARDRANEYINSLSATEIAKIRKDGRLSTDQLSQLTTAIQPNQRGTEWNFAMNSLANPRIDLEDDPRNPGGVRVKRVYDNYQFDRESDVSFDLPGKPIQRAVETFQNQNIKNDSLRTTYQLDQSDPGNTRNTRRLPSYHEFSYDLPPGRLGPLSNLKYTGPGSQKYGKNLTGISSNLISPSTGGGSSAMKIQSANKKGFGY